MRYKVRVVRSGDGVSVSVPGLPGCWSQGATEPEALDNIRSAIEEYVAAVSAELDEAEIREVEVPI